MPGSHNLRQVECLLPSKSMMGDGHTASNGVVCPFDAKLEGVFTLVTASYLFDVDCSFFDVNVKI